MTIPPLPKVTDVRQPGERGFSLGGSVWFGNPKPAMEKGSADNPYSGSTGLRGTPKLDQGFEFAVTPTGHDVIRVTYFASQAAGGSYIPGAVQVWNEFYPANTFLDTNFRLKSLKISYEYLTWPYPVKASKFRLKTLWQFQYTTLHTGFDAPLAPVTDSLGNFITDANGNVVGYNTQGTVHFMLPSVGVQVQEWVTPRFRLEASASGFAVPHHSNTWDAEAGISYRILHYELRLGVRSFHFRTTPSAQYWFRGTMTGPFVGLRLYSD